MPNPIPEQLFLRDPRNLAFVAGSSHDIHHSQGGTWGNLLGGTLFIAMTFPPLLEWMRGLGAGGCILPSVLSCLEALFNNWRPEIGGLWIALGMGAFGVGTGIRNRSQEARLKVRGEIVFGRVVALPESDERDAEDEKQHALTFRYSFTVGQQARYSEETVTRPALHETWPLFDTPVAVLYVDEDLWELL